MIFRLTALAVAGLLLSGPLNAQTDPQIDPQIGSGTNPEIGAEAEAMPVPTDARVLDLGTVLDATEEARIDRLLQSLETDTGVAMEVVILTDIADFGGTGARMDAYAQQLFDAWDVGSADRDDGILLLVTSGDREARIALGDGYPQVYDERAARVLVGSVLPDVREGRFAAGIEAGIVAARLRLVGPFREGRPVSATEGFDTGRLTLPAALPYIAGAIGVIGLIAFLALRAARVGRTCPSCGAETLTRTTEVIDPPTARTAGSGLEHRLCRNCGFTDRRTYAIRRGARAP